MKTKFILFFLIFISTLTFGQTEAERQKIVASTNVAELSKLSSIYDSIFKSHKTIANQMAKIKGWPLTTQEKNGGISELIRLDEFGNPVYYQTDNVGAAQTTRANRLNSGGSLGLNLDGQNMNIGIWDGGKVRNTHLLLTGKVTQVDNAPALSSHATHVGGTMMGNATASASAKGMASQASLRAYDWNSDNSEVAAAAANGLLVSNHSYGNGPQNVQVYDWGKYDFDARSFDNIMFNAPYYQFVNSAGNSRNAGYNPDKDGYDLLSGKSTSKNGIIVAAVNQVTNYSGPASVGMSGFSSWGPTDDGRIKPDISGKGVNVRSSVSSSNTAYEVYSGTSMASPNVAGTLLLLQQHYNNLKSSFMRASTLRGLVIHTADEAGSDIGPDYRFGWGLLNAEKAAVLITNEGVESKIVEKTLNQGNNYSFNIQPKVTTKAMQGSICWTDPAGVTITNNIVDFFSPSLVNDLDIRINKNSEINYPWKLNPAIVDDPAIKADNLVDNIERVDINNPSGIYTVTISHKKNLTNDLQNYSLIMSNVFISPLLLSTNFNLQNSICQGTTTTTFNFQMETKTPFAETVSYVVTGLPAGSVGTFLFQSQTVAGANSLTITNLNSINPGEYPIVVTATSATATSNLFFKIVIQNSFSNFPLLDFPINNATQIDANTSLVWESLGSNVENYVVELAKDVNFGIDFQTFTSAITQLDISNLDFGTKYFWRVKAINVCGESNFSEIFNFSTYCSNDIVITFTNQTINGVTATWTNPNASSSFEILVVPQGNSPTGAYTTVSTNSFTFDTLNSYSSYDIYLRSSCYGNTFSAPIVKPFSTLINHCFDGVFFDSGNTNSNYNNGEYTTTTMSPINLGDQVSVTFTSFSLEDGADNLRIFNGPDINSPFIQEEYGFTGTNSPGTITSTHPSGKLTFLFYSDGINTASGWNATVSCANLATIKNVKKTFTYYPNPASNNIKFLGLETIKSISAYSAIGQLLKTQKINAKENTFDISNFPAGNYFFKVETESATKTVKIIKQ
jgi:Subtilase family/Secretion system C-terminal sorting domain